MPRGGKIRRWQGLYAGMMEVMQVVCMQSRLPPAGVTRECPARERLLMMLPEAGLQRGQLSVADLESVFSLFLHRRRCRYTPQRKAIALAFWSAEGHLSIEELFVRVHGMAPSVGQSTVYRTMRLLCEAGLAREVSFGRGVVRYERAGSWEHEHFICEGCGRSIEFVDPEIDAMGRRVARRLGVTLTQHRLYLYGLCAACAAGDETNPEM